MVALMYKKTWIQIGLVELGSRELKLGTIPHYILSHLPTLQHYLVGELGVERTHLTRSTGLPKSFLYRDKRSSKSSWSRIEVADENTKYPVRVRQMLHRHIMK
jgi:hypothetical protein